MKTFRQIREQSWDSTHAQNPKETSSVPDKQKFVKGKAGIKADMQRAATTEGLRNPADNPCWKGYHPVGTKKKAGRTVPNCVPGKSNEETELGEVAAWQRKEGKNPSGGLNRTGIASYRREHPGSHLSMAVTKKPSELKAGSKAANRRKSFCARMGGMKKHRTSAKTAHDPDSRINKALRKWHCH